MNPIRAFTFAAAFAAALFTASLALADVVKLANGDTLHGKIVSIDDEKVVLESDVFGKVVVARERVLGVVFADGKGPDGGPAVEAEPKTGDRAETPGEIIDRLINEEFGPDALRELSRGAKIVANPGDVVRELQREGIDPKYINELTVAIPGFTAPPVQDYFYGTVEGLKTGRINLGDIRKDAVKVRDQIESLKKDLGPDAAALDGYLGILNGFIEETKDIAPADSATETSPHFPGSSKSAPPTPKEDKK